MKGLRQTAERKILSEVEARSAVCGVVGLGFIGSTFMDALVNAGYEVHGVDRSSEAVNRFASWMKERNPQAEGKWSAACDGAALADTDVVIVAVRTPPQDDGTVDLEPLQAVGKVLQRYERDPRLVLLESTVPCGTTRCFAAWLGTRAGTFVAHSPERLSVGHDRMVLRSTSHLVGAVDPEAGRVAARFLSTVCDHVVPVSSPEVSELSKLLENAFLTTGIALSAEVTRIAHAFGIAAEEVCAAAATKQFGYYPFYPGPGVGGHCLANDLRILISTSKKTGAESSLLKAVAAAAANGPAIVLSRLEELLQERGLQLADGRVLLVGVGFKPGTGDTTESAAREIARLLRQRRAEVSYVDSLVPDFIVDGQAIRKTQPEQLAGESFTAALIVAGDQHVRLERLMAVSEIVLDARGRNSEPRVGRVSIL